MTGVSEKYVKLQKAKDPLFKVPEKVHSPPTLYHCDWFHDHLKKDEETSLPCRDDCQFCMSILHEGVSNKPLIQTCAGADQIKLIKDFPINDCKTYSTEKIQEINQNISGTLFGKMILEAPKEKNEGLICTCSENFCNKNDSIEIPTTIPDTTSNPPETPYPTSNLPKTPDSTINPSTIKTSKIILRLPVGLIIDTYDFESRILKR